MKAKREETRRLEASIATLEQELISQPLRLDLLRARRDSATAAAEQLEAGYTWINSPTRIYDELPFGGFKQSGMGHEHGIEALECYLQSKSVVIGAG